MKKFLLVIISAILVAISSFSLISVNADYSVTIPENKNLAINEYNWAKPSLSSAEFSVDETSGMRFESMVANQQCCTMFNGGRFNEFKLSMYINPHLTVPQEGKADWRYSEFFICFYIDRDTEDLVAEDSKPWYANKVYMSLSMGLTSGGSPIMRFMAYNAFAGNCSASGQNYVGSSNQSVANKLMDGNKHWVELESVNYENGKKMVAYLDGELAAWYDYENDTYYDNDSKRDYDVVASDFEGGIGFYANSDWPAGYSPAKMDNYLVIEEMTIISYDNSSEGEYVDQCTEPVFEITAKDYVTAASYETGELIEIQLSNLFTYEGTKEITYEVKCNNEIIGTVSNGFWSWTPSQSGNYDIDFYATISQDNKAENNITLRVKGNAVSDDNTDKKSSGCKGEIGISVVGVLFGIAGLFTIKRKNK